jgi:hypothetical protein
MKKENLIAQLEGAKALSSQVDIDKVIELIQQLEAPKVGGITQELADAIEEQIERALDRNSEDLIDLSSAEFELSYDNRIELIRADVEVGSIINHVNNCLQAFIIEEDEEEETDTRLTGNIAEEEVTFPDNE